MAAPSGLTLAAAEEFALERDAGLDSLRAQRESLDQSAVAAAELPDPQMRLAALNVPTDSFDLDQEAMTQLQVGLRQSFPPGRSRSLARTRGEVLATVREALARERERSVRRALRRTWTERAYTEGATALLDEQRRWFERLEESASASYQAGRRPQHELLRIAMERELLEENHVELRQSALTWRAELARWLGERSGDAVVDELPVLPPVATPPDGLERVAAHPLVIAAQREVEAGRVTVDLARQSYRPAWAVDVAYGFRDGEDRDGDDRADFLSAMLSFDVPLFTADRQDRRVASAAAEARGRRARLQDLQRELIGRFEASAARWHKLTERRRVFEDRVVPAAEANVIATRQAYRNDVLAFDELVGAEKSLLEARTRLLRLRADRLLAQAELLYLAGDTLGDTP